MAEVLGMFSQDRDEAVQRFRQFHAEQSQESCLDIADPQLEADTVHQIMQDTLNNTGMTVKDLSKVENLPILKDLILTIMNNSRLSGRKISEMTGINRETIRKALLLIGKV